MRDVLASVLLLGGTALAVLGAIGLQRFPDVFARMHAATKPVTLGLLLVLVGAALRMQAAGDVAKLILVGVLTFVTAPVAAHMISRAAYRSGKEMSPDTTVDELGAARAERGGSNPPA